MNRITQLAVIAAVTLMCSTSFGQFTFITPNNLSPSQGVGVGPLGSTGSTVNFDISSNLGLSTGSVILGVDNGFTNATLSAAGNSVWTVSDDEETTFTLSGSVPVRAQVSHGRFLGSDVAANGTQARDGIRTPATESWVLVSNLDPDYQQGSFQPGAVTTQFVDHINTSSTIIENNSTDFLWESTQAVSTFTVFSNNTTALNNNYSVAFSAVPEPASGMLMTFATGLFFLRRKRS